MRGVRSRGAHGLTRSASNASTSASSSTCLSRETDSRGRIVAESKARTAYSMRTHGAASAAGFELSRN